MKLNVLIPDSNDQKFLVWQVINALSLKNEVNIFLLSSEKNNHLKYSRNISHFSFHPWKSHDTWVKIINDEVEKYEIDVILPVYNSGIKWFIENKDHLKFKSKLCILPKLEHYLIASNKGLLSKHLKAHNFPMPKSIVVKTNETPKLRGLNFPVIAKPVTDFGGGKNIKILKNLTEVQNYHKSKNYNCSTIYQNFIKGYDVCCNVVCKEGEIIAYSIQSTILNKDSNLGPQTAFSFVKEETLLNLIKKLMKSFEWSGIANVDCRFDEQDESYKVLEINTRYWINVDASAIAKVNFPYLHCLATLNKGVQHRETKNISYLNLKGLVKRIIMEPTIMLNINFLKNNTPLIFALKDPVPIAYKFVWRTKNLIKKKTRKLF